jgi:hypothetical protein
MSHPIIHELTKRFKDARHKECNYYMADTLLATAALEWAVERLQGRLAECLNTSQGYCDIWYLESHSNCKLLMDLLYEFTEDEKYHKAWGKRTIQ